MPIDDLLDRLEAYKREFSAEAENGLLALLNEIEHTGASTARSLIRLHETLLFLRAYPLSRATARRIDALLGAFASRVRLLDDPLPLEEPDVSGIDGTGITAVFSRDIARYLARAHPRSVSIHWEAWDSPQRLALVLPGRLPLVNDDAAVEAHVPYREWLEAAGGLAWLVEHAENWDALELPLRVEFASRITRTRMRLPGGPLFCHREPLIPRRDVSLASAPAPELRLLGRAEGRRIINLARDTSVVRYRELHGFTYGDEEHVYAARPGRGVVFYVWGVRPEHRLPLRVYHAATMWKNGVPIGYFEGLSLAERMEAGFNLYYTFREGETAWLYSRLLKLFHNWLGIRVTWLDPYQIGHENEEAIGSGAFWFYRKLGYRSVDPAVRELTAKEERKIAARPGYRTPAATLRKMVAAPMVFEYPDAEAGAWDRFETRRIGLTAVRKTRGAAVGDWEALRAAIPDYSRWPARDRAALKQVIAAKGAVEEVEHLRRVQDHARLRGALLRLGSAETARQK